MRDGETIEALLADHQKYHSSYQMDHFITAKSGDTLYGMYKQALRELHCRVHGIRDHYLDLEEAACDIEEHDLEAATSTDDIQKRRAEIKAHRARYRTERIRESLKDQEREARRFWAQAIVLKRELGPLYPGQRESLDREMWLTKIARQASIELRTQRAVSSKTIQTIASLPEEHAVDVLRRLDEDPKRELAIKRSCWESSSLRDFDKKITEVESELSANMKEAIEECPSLLTLT